METMLRQAALEMHEARDRHYSAVWSALVQIYTGKGEPTPLVEQERLFAEWSASLDRIRGMLGDSAPVDELTIALREVLRVEDPQEGRVAVRAPSDTVESYKGKLALMSRLKDEHDAAWRALAEVLGVAAIFGGGSGVTVDNQQTEVYTMKSIEPLDEAAN